jgi:hypothetical protein
MIKKLFVTKIAASVLLLASCQDSAWFKAQPDSTQTSITAMQTAIAQQAASIANTTLNSVATGQNAQQVKNALIQSSGDALRSLEGTATAQVSSALVQGQLDKWVPPSSPWRQYGAAVGGLVQTYVNAHPGNPQWANLVLEAVAGALNTHTP